MQESSIDHADCKHTSCAIPLPCIIIQKINNKITDYAQIIHIDNNDNNKENEILIDSQYNKFDYYYDGNRTSRSYVYLLRKNNELEMVSCLTFFKEIPNQMWNNWFYLHNQESLFRQSLKYNGGGFISSPLFEHHHRDIIAMSCLKRSKHVQFFHDEKMIKSIVDKAPEYAWNLITNYLFQENQLNFDNVQHNISLLKQGKICL
jgi:hypothetical protein